MSLPKQLVFHLSYAAETSSTSVELIIDDGRSSLASSARLSKRPSPVTTAPAAEIWGCFSRRDSLWCGRRDRVSRRRLSNTCRHYLVRREREANLLVQDGLGQAADRRNSIFHIGRSYFGFLGSASAFNKSVTFRYPCTEARNVNPGFTTVSRFTILNLRRFLSQLSMWMARVKRSQSSSSPRRDLCNARNRRFGSN